MSTHLENIVKEVRELSPIEQIELLNAISQLLHNSFKQLPKFSDFWIPKKLNQLFNEQYHQPVKNVSDFAADFWPADESVDEFNKYICNQRQFDQMSER